MQAEMVESLLFVPRVIGAMPDADALVGDEEVGVGAEVREQLEDVGHRCAVRRNVVEHRVEVSLSELDRNHGGTQRGRRSYRTLG